LSQVPLVRNFKLGGRVISMAPQSVQLLIGIAVLTLGRRLFWIFVGTAGFLLGTKVATQFPIGGPEWTHLAVALFAGLIGAVFAVFAQKLAVGIAGFVTGGYILAWLFLALGLEGTGWMWPALVSGGIAGAILVLFVFDWALIVLSSLTGAMMVIQATGLNLPMNVLLFLVLLSIGIAIQTLMLERR
jgi:hypothetical protein